MVKRNLLGIIVLVSVFTLGNSVGAVDERHSCNPDSIPPQAWAQAMVENVSSGRSKPEAFKEIEELQVFTENDLAVAATMLARGCCELGIMQEDACEGYTQGPNYQAQSAYVTDHLMMIGMTKLDGDTEVCETLGLESCEMASSELDVQPVERREKIRDIAQSTDGYSSQHIHELFKLYRGDENVLDPQKTTTGYMPHAYIRLCQEVTLLGTMSGLSNAELDVQQECIKAIQFRYDQEKAYVQTLLVEKGAQFVGNMMRDYLQGYFADQRLAGLLTKYGVLDACRRMVLRTVQKTDDCCT